MRAGNCLTSFLTVAGARLGLARAPLAVSLSVTDRCNLRCAYCAIWRREGEQLDTATLRELVDDLHRSGARRLTFTGGEPLLRDDLGGLVAHASAKGMFTTVNTNGLLVRERLGELKGVDYLKISLDGPGDVHDVQRPGGGDVEEILEGARQARAAGLKVTLNMTLTRHNLRHLQFVVDAAVRLGVQADFNRLSPHALAGGAVDELTPPPEELGEAVDWLIARRGVANISSSLPYLRFLARSICRDGEGLRRCYAGRLFCYIDTNGDVFPCFDMRGKGDFGNAARDGVRECFLRIPAMACRRCYCSAAIELNLLAEGTPGSVANLFKWI